MNNLVGLYHLRKLWDTLQFLEKEQKSGIINFNFEYWKKTHSIAPDAKVPE